MRTLAFSSLLLATLASQTALAQKYTPAVQADSYQTKYLSGQAWLPEVRQRFYFTAQGSKIIPYEWAMALTTTDGKIGFFTSQNLSRYGYIPQQKSDLNKDGLPIGFTRDENVAGFTKSDARAGKIPKYARLAQLGINCAACHTSELSYRGLKLRIDGGPSYSNFQMFTKEMDEAIDRVASKNNPTESNNKAFISFAARVGKRTLGKDISELSSSERRKFLANLRTELAEFNQSRQKWQRHNGLETAGIVYGPGRNDAFGAIFNQALGVFLDREDNIRPANAPVKYPVIWDAPAHEVVQWVGIARNNKDAGGPIARNIGQVLGVFGHTDVHSDSYINGYCTSSKRKELNDMEEWIGSLRSPTWPKEVFGFDEAKAARGRVHYQKNCQGCHQLNERTPEEALSHAKELGLSAFPVSKSLSPNGRKANEKMIPIDGEHGVNTDSLVAENAYGRTAKSGPLTGRKLRVLNGRPLEDVEPGATVLRHVVAGSILGSFSYLTCENTPRDGQANLGLAKKIGSSLLGFTKEDMDLPNFEARMAGFKEALSKYKARPLNGIWAAPPYLHNGSVRSLKQLLTAPGEREKSFDFNCNEFDPIAVGLDCSNVTEQNRAYGGQFKFDTEAVKGNSNQGHAFGTQLSDDEKMELIEFIKAL